MTLPSFYHAERVGELYTPDILNVTRQALANKITPSEQDETRTALMLIDMQVDFIHPEGALSVPGAVDDTQRTIEWMYNNLEGITTVFASLDSHLPLQIFSPSWWVDETGQHPEPYTVISAETVMRGKWHPVYEVAWSKQYVQILERDAKKQLMIWPYHTLTGTVGHNFMPALYEAITYHSSVRQTQPEIIIKGSIAKSEHYSIFEPEVKLDNLNDGGLNKSLLEQLTEYEKIYVAGEAKSHCVLETISTMMRYFAERPEIIQRIHVLEDCMSSVAHPEIDFESIAKDALNSFAKEGLQLVSSSS
jgi:nicotinamidase/pyrazinamidase